MKKAALLLVFPFISMALSGQTYCGSSRYDTEIFPNVTKTSDITYGQNKDLNGNMKTLKMDIYEPTGDVAVQRPLIVLAHGGSFIAGSKTDANQVALCTRFAKRGYVVAAIDYRLGMGFPINQANGQKACWRAMQDMKAAVRFFRKDAATTNTYKIDPNFIFVGGYSAGAIMGVQYAYMDHPSEIPAAIDTVALGGLEGTSGNPGYSTAINGVLNFAGAVGDTAWMKPGDEPMVSIQGDNDGTVPYCTALISVSGFPIMVMSGSGTMHIRSFNLGLENPIHTYYNQDHGAGFVAANEDTSVSIASDFVYKRLGCAPSGPQVFINNQTCVPMATGISGVNPGDKSMVSFPNPATESLVLSITGANGNIFSANIIDVTGRVARQFSFSGKEYLLERKNIPAGIYSVEVISNENEQLRTKIIFY